jgi:hypothetical protein
VTPRVNGGWLREQRQARRWDVAEMARRLADAAKDSRGDLPDHECLVRYIRRWESGSGVSERYRLYPLPTPNLGEASRELFPWQALKEALAEISPGR